MTEVVFSMSERSTRILNYWVISEHSINSCFSTELILTGENTTERFLLCRGFINKSSHSLRGATSWINLRGAWVHSFWSFLLAFLSSWGGLSCHDNKKIVSRSTSAKHLRTAPYLHVFLGFFFLSADTFPLEHTRALQQVLFSDASAPALR